MKKVICSEKAPGAIGPYSQAIEANGMVFVSGQLPIDAATGQMAEGIEGQARQSLENIKHILEEAGLTMGNIAKTTVFLQDMSLFAGMNGVYATYFDGAFPAIRSVSKTAGISTLAKRNSNKKKMILLQFILFIARVVIE